MDSLADKIISANSATNGGQREEKRFFNIDFPEIDEYGLPTLDSIDYFVARLMFLDYLSDDGHLHFRQNDDHIWKGDQWVAENSENLYRLAEWRYVIKPYQKELIWKRVREILPTLSRDKYMVTDKLIWDRTTATLKEVKNKVNTIK